MPSCNYAACPFVKSKHEGSTWLKSVIAFSALEDVAIFCDGKFVCIAYLLLVV